MSFEIAAYQAHQEPEIVALSLKAWAPVFEKLQPAVPDYVFRAVYPDGWRARQAADVLQVLRAEGDQVRVVTDASAVIGWIGQRRHPKDRMGEIYILAVDPAHLRRGAASALMQHAVAELREARLDMVMVETGGDPGHASCRATYESFGFERWPVARYFRKLS